MIWISFDQSIWRFPLMCSFREFSNIWFSIIHNKSISYQKILNFISINSIFFLVSKYIIFVIFWHLLVLWFYRILTVGQSHCFDFEFWLSSVKSEILNLKTCFSIFLSFKFIISYFYLFKTFFKPTFDQVNSAIKVNHVLCGSTRYLCITWFYIFIFVNSVL